MSINETRAHYRYSKDEKQHIKRWGNVVLVLLLIAVLGTIYAYLRFDGLGLNDNDRSNDTTLVEEPPRSEERAKYDFLEDLRSGTGSIFDEIPEDDNQTVTNNAAPAEDLTDDNSSSENLASESANAATAGNAPPPPATMQSLDGADTNNTANAAQNQAPIADATESANDVSANANANANTEVELPPIQLSRPVTETQQPEPSPEPSPQPEPEPVSAPAPPATSNQVASAPPATSNQNTPAAPSRSEISTDPNNPRTLSPEDLGQPLNSNNQAAAQPTSAQPSSQASSNSNSNSVGIAFQVGSFSSRENAERMRADLAFMGIQAQVLPESGQFRVVTSRSNGASRQSIENRLRREGIDYFPRF